MKISAEATARLQLHLSELYGSTAVDILPQIQSLLERYSQQIQVPATTSWDQNDVVLITYGDQVQADGHPALSVLGQFLRNRSYDQLISTIHLLPIFPYSSDDGFSVIDFRQIDPALGTWNDVNSLQSHFDLMYDLVLNHCSQQSEWFQKYLQCESPYDEYFCEASPTDDLSAVVRPRSLPLLTEYTTSNGIRHLWTTFSADQIDLNYRSPRLLMEMLDILLVYVANGARIVRLDAIAYLWKEIGTPCIHHKLTHTVVKLMREVLECVAPHVLIMTETNVPHEENVSYFGDGDEAQMVYQFSLPPLLLDAFIHQDATILQEWLIHLDPPKAGTTYFNFTASHDGIGVRPLEGIVSPERLANLVDAVRERNGLVGMRRLADGSDSPYELNISYVDAIQDITDPSVKNHARRFLASQAVMLALQGIPGVYFHSLVGTQNDLDGVAQSGINRRINRRKFQRNELETRLNTADSRQNLVSEGYRRLLEVRRSQQAFHPDSPQHIIPSESRNLLLFVRTAADRSVILVAANFGSKTHQIDLSKHGRVFTNELISGTPVPLDSKIVNIAPGECLWFGGVA